jgi:hypothetical protein
MGASVARHPDAFHCAFSRRPNILDNPRSYEAVEIKRRYC